ncbi:MAG TPA: hypothetical protein VF058_04280 [Actinomycetota bacterium]
MMDESDVLVARAMWVAALPAKAELVDAAAAPVWGDGALLRTTTPLSLAEISEVPPAGGADGDGIPEGIQLAGSAVRDDRLLEVARSLQRFIRGGGR